MKRRDFITLLGGAVAAWPLAARAQHTPRLPTIGALSPITASVENHRVAAFVQRLRELAWIEGRTAAVKVRWAEGRSLSAAAWPRRTAELKCVPAAQQESIFAQLLCCHRVRPSTSRYSSAVIEIPRIEPRQSLGLDQGALQRLISTAFGNPSEARDLAGGP